MNLLTDLPQRLGRFVGGFPVGHWIGGILIAAVVMFTATDALGQSKGIFSKSKSSSDESKADTPKASPAKAAAKVPAKKVVPPSVDKSGRPKFKVLRHEEDWSGFTGQDSDHPLDAIKHVQLSDDGSVWASFGGHFRVRTESWGRFNFGATANDDDSFTLVRLMLHSDLHFGENFRIFVEGKSAGSTQRSLPGGHRTIDVDTLDLEQAFFDLIMPLEDDESLTLRVGRQALLFGKQRLVSPLPWTNTLRRWDGVTAVLETSDGWKASAFYTQFAPVNKFRFNDADEQTEFSGVYATHAGEGVDLYWLYLRKEDPVTFNGTMGNEKRHTLGGRLWGKFKNQWMDYDIEGAYQVGDVGSADIKAFMFASEFGFNFADQDGRPRFHIGFDYASGDDTAGDNAVETFNQLFPLGHAYLGFMDVIGRQNIVDLSGGMTFHPIDKLMVKITGHFFWRAEVTDNLYSVNGTVSRTGGVGTRRQVGSEIDLLVKYPFTPHLTGTVGYSHFFAGDFIEQTGTHRDIDFFYLIMQYTF